MDEIYSSIHKLNIPTKDFEKILDLMQKEKEFEFSKPIPEEIFIISCNCSDRSIEDNPADGYISEVYPNIIFADPESRPDFFEIIAHELIHILQDTKYFKFKDMYEDTYRERWFEEMAFKLENQVKKYISAKNLELITDNEIEIENFMSEHIKLPNDFNFDIEDL